MGYPPHTKSYIIFLIEAKKVIVSRNLIFHDVFSLKDISYNDISLPTNVDVVDCLVQNYFPSFEQNNTISNVDLIHNDEHDASPINQNLEDLDNQLKNSLNISSKFTNEHERLQETRLSTEKFSLHNYNWEANKTQHQTKISLMIWYVIQHIIKTIA